MPDWGVALICIAIVIVAILISSLVKLIMKKVATKNGGTFDCKKWEYLYAAISLILSAVGVFCFLKFFLKITDINVIWKTVVVYAGSVQTVYLFIVQLVRKGGKGIISLFAKLFSNLKKSSDPIKELPEIIGDEVETTEETKISETSENAVADSVENTEDNQKDDDFNKLSDEFIKVITGKNK